MEQRLDETLVERVALLQQSGGVRQVLDGGCAGIPRHVLGTRELEVERPDPVRSGSRQIGELGEFGEAGPEPVVDEPPPPRVGHGIVDAQREARPVGRPEGPTGRQRELRGEDRHGIGPGPVRAGVGEPEADTVVVESAAHDGLVRAGQPDPHEDGLWWVPQQVRSRHR